MCVRSVVCDCPSVCVLTIFPFDRGRQIQQILWCPYVVWRRRNVYWILRSCMREWLYMVWNPQTKRHPRLDCWSTATGTHRNILFALCPVFVGKRSDWDSGTFWKSLGSKWVLTRIIILPQQTWMNGYIWHNWYTNTTADWNRCKNWYVTVYAGTQNGQTPIMDQWFHYRFTSENDHSPLWWRRQIPTNVSVDGHRLCAWHHRVRRSSERRRFDSLEQHGEDIIVIAHPVTTLQKHHGCDKRIHFLCIHRHG